MKPSREGIAPAENELQLLDDMKLLSKRVVVVAEYTRAVKAACVRSCLRFIFSLCSLSAFAQQTLQVPTAYPTIQGAIDAASAGDTIAIAPGTYDENIDFKGKSITVEGTGAQQDALIDGGMRGAVVSMISGEGRTALLKNLTLQHGSSANPFPANQLGAGGIFIMDSSPSIVDVTIRDSYECGIGAYRSSPLIQGSTVISTTDSGTVEGCPLQQGVAGSNYARGTAILLDSRAQACKQSLRIV